MTRAVAARVVVGVIVILVVSAGAFTLPFLLGGSGVSQGPDQPSWNESTLAVDRVPASGHPAPTGDVGTVLFDREHSNRFTASDIQSLTQAIADAGGEVRYTGSYESFEEGLTAADVFVVIDPAREFTADEIDAVESFVDEGGHLVLFGEPDRKRIVASGLGVSIETIRTRLTALASTYGIAFGSAYIYDMSTRDGGFKNPLVSPPNDSDASLVQSVDQVAFYTATTVTANRGEVILQTSPTGTVAGRDEGERVPVAVLHRNGEVLAVGDKTFLSADVSSVGDNEILVTRIVEFMAAA